MMSSFTARSTISPTLEMPSPYMMSNSASLKQVEEEIRKNSFKLMTNQAKAAAKAAGRAVDVSAEDFDDGGSDGSDTDSNDALAA